jgi:hypothetical protein
VFSTLFHVTSPSLLSQSVYCLSCLSFLGSTAQLRPWPPPQNPAEFLGGFSTIFFFTGWGRNPHAQPPSPRTRPLYLYPPEAGWLPILVAYYDTHALQWDYSYFPGHHTEKIRVTSSKMCIGLPQEMCYHVKRQDPT